MIEQFTIRDTEAGFAAWLQAYGRVIDPTSYTYAAGDYPDRSIRHGALEFAIVQESPERLTATVELGESASDKLKAYLAALAVAIRKKYKIETEPEPKGMYYATEAKVREAHRRLKEGELWDRVKNTCSYETYIRWCLKVTGEEPILRQK